MVSYSAWKEALPLEVHRQFRRLYPGESLEAIAIRAINLPDYADEFARLGPQVVVRSEITQVRVPTTNTKQFVALLIEAMLSEDSGDSPTSGPASAVASARPPLPNPTQLSSYTRGTLLKAVRDFANQKTRGDVVRGAKLPPADARRVRLMTSVGLLGLNAEQKLVVDDRVARTGSRVVLRFLDESGTRWLDPNVELRGR